MKEQLEMYFSDEPNGEEYGKEGDEENWNWKWVKEGMMERNWVSHHNKSFNVSHWFWSNGPD